MRKSPIINLCNIKRFVLFFVIQFAMGVPLTSHAVEIADVDVADNVSVGGQQLTLNGAGIRRKFFFKIYIGALYLKSPLSSAAQVLDDPNPKRVHMHFLYDEVSSKKLADGWTEGFENNLTETEMAALQSRLTKFNILFTDMRKGDNIDFDFIPATGVSVTINGQKKGEITGKDFNRALLSVWLGKEPADSSLKEAMLGVEE